MKKIFKNRIFIGGFALSIALFISFVLAPQMIKNAEHKTEVIRLSQDVKKGDQFTADMLKPLEVYDYNIPSNMVLYSSIDNVIGKYATSDVYENANILVENLSSEPLSRYTYLTGLTEGELAISISIDSIEKALSDKLESGDIVQVFASDVGENGETIAPELLQYVEVIAVTQQSGDDLDEVEDENEKENTSTVTLKVNEAQAMEVVDLNANASIHLVLVYRGSENIANAYLEKQLELMEVINE